MMRRIAKTRPVAIAQIFKVNASLIASLSLSTSLLSSWKAVVRIWKTKTEVVHIIAVTIETKVIANDLSKTMHPQYAMRAAAITGRSTRRSSARKLIP